MHTSGSSDWNVDWFGASSAFVASIANLSKPCKFEGCLGWLGRISTWFTFEILGASIDKGLVLLLEPSCSLPWLLEFGFLWTKCR